MRHAQHTVALVLLITCLACGPGEPPSPKAPERLGPYDFRFPENALVAHALGGIRGKNYSNSVEAFEATVARGGRFMEVDLSFTADDDLVCFHTKHEKHLGIETLVTEMTTDEFLGYKYAGKYTLMDLESLMRRMVDAPDVYLVTDCKQAFRPCMDEVVSVAEAVDPALIGRIIPQFFSPEQWLDVAEMEARHGSFASVIFTLYRSNAKDPEVVELVAERGVPTVTMSRKRFSPEFVRLLSEVGVDSLVHTVNKHEGIIQLAEQGVRGVYSDRFFTWDEVLAKTADVTGGR